MLRGGSGLAMLGGAKLSNGTSLLRVNSGHSEHLRSSSGAKFMPEFLTLSRCPEWWRRRSATEPMPEARVTPLRLLLLLALTLLCCPGWGAGQSSVSSPAPVRIGQLDGTPEFTFGRIADVAVGGGTVFVLDEYGQDVRAFDLNGDFLKWVGRSGHGPGEFAAARALAVNSQGELIVLDPGNLRVTRFRNRPEGVGIAAELPLDRFARDVCVLGDRIFVLTSRSPDLMAEVTWDGEVVASFGAPVSPDASLRQRIGRGPFALLNHGHIVCDEERGRLYYASEMLPVVRAYSDRGEPLWEVALSDFVPVHLSRVPQSRGGGCCSMAADPESGVVDTAADLALGEQGLMVTVNRTRPATDLDGTFELRLLDVANGQELQRRPSEIQVAGNYGGKPFGYAQVPFPMVLIHR